MAKMVLGGYTFVYNPTTCTIPREIKSYSHVQLYSGEAYFSWDTSLVGQRIDIYWEWMQVAQWNNLYALLQADAQTTWQPQDGHTYNVEVLELDGAYLDSSLLEATLRKDVTLKLLIMGTA